MFQYEIMNEYDAMQERFQLLKAGNYDAVIYHSEDKMSSSGNPMMALQLNVYDEQGCSHTIRDFLVFTKKMMWKVIHCAESAGIIEEYKRGHMCSENIIGKKVRIKLGVEDGKHIPEEKLQGKEPGARYPDKNKIDDYLKHDSATISTGNDDDVPF